MIPPSQDAAGTSAVLRQSLVAEVSPASLANVDEAASLSGIPPCDPWPTMKRDVLSCLAWLGSAAAFATGGAPLVGAALALGGTFSALLKWGPDERLTREAAFKELIAELREAGVAEADIEKLAGVGRDHVTQATLFHAIFPELSTEALASWLKEVERIDVHRLLDFGRIVVALRDGLNASPLTRPDEVLRTLPLRNWVRAAQHRESHRFDPGAVGVETPLAAISREALTWFYADFRPTSVDPRPVRATQAERAAVADRDAATWLALNDSRQLDAGRAAQALNEWQASAAQRALRQQKDALVEQKQHLKAGTQSRQLGRHIRVVELSEALLKEPDKEKRDVMRRELAAEKEAIALWNLPKAERTVQHKQDRGELLGFEPPRLPEPKGYFPVLDRQMGDAPQDEHSAANVTGSDSPLAMATSAASRHGGVLQALPRLIDDAGRSLGAAVGAILSWGISTLDVEQRRDAGVRRLARALASQSQPRLALTRA